MLKRNGKSAAKRGSHDARGSLERAVVRALEAGETALDELAHALQAPAAQSWRRFPS